MKRPMDLVPSPDAVDPVTCECCGAPRAIRRGRRVGVITLPMLPKTMNEREGLLFAAITKKRPGMAHVVREETRKIYAALQRAADRYRLGDTTIDYEDWRAEYENACNLAGIAP